MSFYQSEGLNVATYDLFHPSEMAGTLVAHDVAFYRSLADETGGPILELACGTGRVALSLAAAGFDVVGLDISRPMLRVARRKRAAAPAEVAKRVTLVEGDMTGFDLRRTFALVVVPFRSFQALLTPEAQRSCLARVHRHLRDAGLLALDLFDPILPRVSPELPTGVPATRGNVALPDGHRVEVAVVERTTDPVTQQFGEVWAFVETDEAGNEVRVEHEELRLRWSYRYELRHLLELSGFRVEQEYSDFLRSPPAYGKELLFVARRPSAPTPSR